MWKALDHHQNNNNKLFCKEMEEKNPSLYKENDTVTQEKKTLNHFWGCVKKPTLKQYKWKYQLLYFINVCPQTEHSA